MKGRNDRLAFEWEPVTRHGRTAWVPKRWKLLTLDRLEVDLKLEFSQRNRGLSGQPGAVIEKREVRATEGRESRQTADRATCGLLAGGDSARMKTVAIIGASNDRSKYGNKAVRAFLQQGYAVYPVSLKETEVEGLKAYASLLDLPVRPDMVSVYVPPPVLLRLLPEIAAKGCDELWLNPGTESDAVLAETERLGLNAIQACSILGVGLSPSEL